MCSSVLLVSRKLDMELLSPTTPEFQYLVAVVDRSKTDHEYETNENVPIIPEPIVLKNPAKVLSMKLKNKNATISEVPEEEIQGNPIGMLQELCMMRRWMPPEYRTEQEEGLPHERLFTILCSVGNFKEYGVGRSKKLAKRQSAHKMVQKILTIPAEDETILRNLEDDDEIVERFTSQKGGRGSTMNNGASRRISLFHKNLKTLVGVRLEKIKNMNADQFHDVDAVKWLKEIAAENKLDVTYVNIEEKSKSNKCQCLVQLSTIPVAVCHGTADTIIEAQREAVVEALKYIHLLSK
ncbi:hypothetical protein V9T40_004817 [Parthenolecanium corni]|uniref:DRBM domain-containing protein n=1 Tax=Parthenolecanium corni TaxID=536013 RepID=A0AAN9TES1_9HEMI